MDTPASRQQRKSTRSCRHGLRLYSRQDIGPAKVANLLLAAALAFPLAHVPAQVPAQSRATPNTEASILPLLGESRNPRAQLAQAGIDDSHWHQLVDGSV